MSSSSLSSESTESTESTAAWTSSSSSASSQTPETSSVSTATVSDATSTSSVVENTPPPSGLPQFVADVLVVIPPIPAKVFDKYWLRLLTISSPNPAINTFLHAEFRPARDTASGIKELKEPEVEGDIKVLRIDDLFGIVLGTAEPDLSPETRGVLQLAMGYVLQGLLMYAKEKHVF